ncbi:MAG TPA: MXAN_5187 family protein [Kofleriaceae bacterium]
MFLSKIWFFLIALVAAIALTIALTLPRPAQRHFVEEEHKRLSIACGVVDIQLADDARKRLELTGTFARSEDIVKALTAASGADKIDEARMKPARDTAEKVMTAVSGRKPDFAVLIDKRGRVVASVNLDQNDPGDVVAGRPLVDDALAGYLRDDLWTRNGTMYFVTASPVIKRDAPVEYVGAVVLGHQVTNDLAKFLVKTLDVELEFYMGKDAVAGSKSLAIDASQMLPRVKALTDPDRGKDCLAEPLEVTSGKESYTEIERRLPGEAGARGAFYSVLIQRPSTIGFMGTLHGVKKSDLTPGRFPWHFVGAGFVIVLAIGIALMMMEADRPLKRLTADAVKLAKGESERLSEDAHGGKFGSIARSVNIHIDKVSREAKTAKKDIDALLGPAPEGSLGTIDLLATALPSARPGGPAPAASAPPSDFKFSAPPPAPTPPPASFKPSGPPASIPKPAAAPPPKPAAPAPPAPPTRAPTPPPVAMPAAAPAAPSLLGGLGDSLDDDILGGLGLSNSGPTTGLSNPAIAAPEPAGKLGSTADGEAHFRQVYEQFLTVKKTCGEPTAGLSFEKFSEKLVKNRDDLMAKTGCKEVRFTVYVKEGKAALKATPVKDE